MELLEPSSRSVRLIANMRIGNNLYSSTAFVGNITNYSESHGYKRGSINITAKSIANSLQNRSTQDLTRLTAYRLIFDELAASGFIPTHLAPIMLANDRAITADSYDSLIDLVSSVIAGAVDITSTLAGGVIVSKKGLTVPVGSTFSLSDNIQTTVSRSKGSGTSYNTVDVIGLSGGTVINETVLDAEDVEARGIVRAPEVYGTIDTDLEENKSDALRWISEMIRGEVSIQCRLNPYLVAGGIIDLTSARLFIDSTKAKIGAATHRFGNRSAETTLSNVGLIE